MAATHAHVHHYAPSSARPLLHHSTHRPQPLPHAAPHPPRHIPFVRRYSDLIQSARIIGRGAEAVVKLAQNPSTCLPNDSVYAVKKFCKCDKSRESERDHMKRIRAEFCISSSLNHPHIVRALDLLQDPHNRWLQVMEFCPAGDLFSILETAGPLPSLEVDCLFKQLLHGVSYLHSVGVAHRDLKPENLLLDFTGCLKISDFGAAEVVQSAFEPNAHLSMGKYGSTPYIAPECFTKDAYAACKSDIWSCGIIYLVLINYTFPWHQATSKDSQYLDYLRVYDKRVYPLINNLSSCSLSNLLYDMLNPDPTLRLSMKQIVHSEGFKALRTCQECDDEGSACRIPSLSPEIPRCG